MLLLLEVVVEAMKLGGWRRMCSEIRAKGQWQRPKKKQRGGRLEERRREGGWAVLVRTGACSGKCLEINSVR